jgi:hypothetical protein
VALAHARSSTAGRAQRQAPRRRAAGGAPRVGRGAAASNRGAAASNRGPSSLSGLASGCPSPSPAGRGRELAATLLATSQMWKQQRPSPPPSLAARRATVGSSGGSVVGPGQARSVCSVPPPGVAAARPSACIASRLANPAAGFFSCKAILQYAFTTHGADSLNLDPKRY